MTTEPRRSIWKRSLVGRVGHFVKAPDFPCQAAAVQTHDLASYVTVLLARPTESPIEEHVLIMPNKKGLRTFHLLRQCPETTAAESEWHR